MPERHRQESATQDLGWWTLHGTTIIEALHRVHKGEHPDVVFAEMYANAEDHRITDEDE